VDDSGAADLAGGIICIHPDVVSDNAGPDEAEADIVSGLDRRKIIHHAKLPKSLVATCLLEVDAMHDADPDRLRPEILPPHLVSHRDVEVHGSDRIADLNVMDIGRTAIRQRRAAPAGRERRHEQCQDHHRGSADESHRSSFLPEPGSKDQHYETRER